MNSYEVYYQNSERLEKAGVRACYWERKVSPGEIKGYYDLAAVVHAESMEEVFHIMNGMSREFPNPLESPNGQKWVGESGVYHSSMSVNDVIREVGSEVYYKVAGCGFEKVEYPVEVLSEVSNEQ